jgi:hypothetical protein
MGDKWKTVILKSFKFSTPTRGLPQALSHQFKILWTKAIIRDRPKRADRSSQTDEGIFDQLSRMGRETHFHRPPHANVPFSWDVDVDQKLRKILSGRQLGLPYIGPKVAVWFIAIGWRNRTGWSPGRGASRPMLDTSMVGLTIVIVL